MAEQRPDGQPGPGQEPVGEDGPGSAVEPAQQATPEQDLDAEQLRQFEQFRQFREFQQFQEFQRLQQAQQAVGDELTSAPQYQPMAVPTQQLVQQPPARPRPKVPGWVRWLGKKILGWLIAFLLLILALTWAYNYFLGGDDSDSSGNQAAIGGQKLKKNFLMEEDPYGAVRFVYDNIAQNVPEDACVRFDYPNKVDQKFAQDLGYSNCNEAIGRLHAEVTSPDTYAESIPSGVPTELYGKVSGMRAGETVEVDSCEAAAIYGGIKGGPALGTFILTKQDYKDQWLITGHKPGPRTCPAPSSTGN